MEQECIPVGCILPTHYCTGGIHDRDPPWTETLCTETPGQRPPLDIDPSRQRPPRRRSPWTETPLDRERPPGTETPPPGTETETCPVDRQTPVKT